MAIAKDIKCQCQKRHKFFDIFETTLHRMVMIMLKKYPKVVC